MSAPIHKPDCLYVSTSWTSLGVRSSHQLPPYQSSLQHHPATHRLAWILPTSHCAFLLLLHLQHLHLLVYPSSNDTSFPPKFTFFPFPPFFLPFDRPLYQYGRVEQLALARSSFGRSVTFNVFCLAWVAVVLETKHGERARAREREEGWTDTCIRFCAQPSATGQLVCRCHRWMSMLLKLSTYVPTSVHQLAHPLVFPPLCLVYTDGRSGLGLVQ